MRKSGIYLLLLLCAAFTASCSATRYVPAGEYLLDRNVIKTDKNTKRSQRITEDELDRFVRQSPPRKFLRTNLLISLWSMSDTSRNTFSNRALRALGSAPVILDSSQVLRSANNIESYLRSRGYYESNLDWSVSTRGKKAKVTYTVTQGLPYLLGDISYSCADQALAPVVLADSANTLLHKGDIFDIGVMNAERSRISDYLRDRGYYDFSVNNISYIADSTAGKRTVDITMIVHEHLSGYTVEGQAEYEKNKVYRIGSVYVNPSYDPVAIISDPQYYDRQDTLYYKGFNILYEGRSKIRGKILRRVINLSPDELFSSGKVQDTYADLMRLGYFRSASILFDKLPYSADTLSSSPHITSRDGYLNCVINCVPALRQSYKIDLEGSVSSNFFAVGASVGYQNRNLFRGAELFDINLTGRHEFLRKTRSTGSYEMGGNTSLSFPQFVLPFSSGFLRKALNPRTKVELSFNYQHRPVYHRSVMSARVTYSWKNKGYGSFAIRPLDMNLIEVSFLDEDFRQSLQNRYLEESYKSQLIPGISVSYLYNNQLRKTGSEASSVVFRINAETMGNLFGALAHAFSDPHSDNDAGGEYYEIFGIRYAQYFRVDASVSHRITLGERAGFVWRLLAGGGRAYGNANSIPIDRLFYSGGSNSMRGWIARRLGPGTVPSQKSAYPTQVGNVKLEANVEFRFPVWDFLNGAVFFDVGNVWFAGHSDYEDPELAKAAMFRFDTFYKQLGFNTGIGARLDFSSFIFTIDWGIKLHDPGQPLGNRWINKFRLKDTALNFGVGYPF